jgi:hypothetical protein
MNSVHQNFFWTYVIAPIVTHTLAIHVVDKENTFALYSHPVANHNQDG